MGAGGTDRRAAAQRAAVGARERAVLVVVADAGQAQLADGRRGLERVAAEQADGHGDVAARRRAERRGRVVRPRGAALRERVLAHVRGAEDGLPLFAGGDAGHAGPDPRADAAAVDEPRDAHDDVDGFVLRPRSSGLAEEAPSAKRSHHLSWGAERV